MTASTLMAAGGTSNLQYILPAATAVVSAGLAFLGTVYAQKKQHTRDVDDENRRWSETRGASKEDWRREQGLRSVSAYNDAIHTWLEAIDRLGVGVTDEHETAERAAFLAIYPLALLADGALVPIAYRLSHEVSRLALDVLKHGLGSTEVAEQKSAVTREKQAFFDHSRADFGLSPLPEHIFDGKH